MLVQILLTRVGFTLQAKNLCSRAARLPFDYTWPKQRRYVWDRGQRDDRSSAGRFVAQGQPLVATVNDHAYCLLHFHSRGMPLFSWVHAHRSLCCNAHDFTGITAEPYLLLPLPRAFFRRAGGFYPDRSNPNATQSERIRARPEPAYLYHLQSAV